jgi:UDP:flavonoid glycosyltransferase YjiC (YdhE family)
MSQREPPACDRRTSSLSVPGRPRRYRRLPPARNCSPRSAPRSTCSRRGGEGALVYLSLGSLGSADVELMRRLVAVLSRTRHRYIVSKGPLHDEFDLADNMWGAAQVPQTNVLPLVDLVITHGGNNTTVECFHFGKPMVVLPLFWDQYDNAQRVAETGFGTRLATYEFDDDDLPRAIDRLLADTSLRTRMAAASQAVRSRDGVSLAADLIEELAARPTRPGSGTSCSVFRGRSRRPSRVSSAG